MYRAADMALVTSLKDGMNLVCKEYCACKGREPGVLFSASSRAPPSSFPGEQSW